MFSIENRGVGGGGWEGLACCMVLALVTLFS